MDQSSLKHYLADDPPSIVQLAIKPHFEALSEKEKLYAHFISVACYAGYRIVLRQVSPESEAIYDLIIELQRACDGDLKALQSKCGLMDEELRHFLNYAAMFLGNGGNYKSFGDSKFIPRIPTERFEKLASAASDKAHKLFARLKEGLYDVDENRSIFGYPEGGHMSTYYPDSPDITREEITFISDFLDKKGLLPENTRLRKTKEGNFEILVASAQSAPAREDLDLTDVAYGLTGKLQGKKATLVYGDYSVEMKKVANALREAQKYAANDTEAQMMADYVKSFETGSMEAWKQSQISWVKDQGPVVESDIGFIETYRDPHGNKGEWEGFVAMVNKERTKAFGELVAKAPEMIPKLPWGKDFEKDKFLSPDFTSLEVLAFCGSGIPAGINIPNFDSIRQNIGFKNVSLGNILSAKSPNEPVPFIHPDDMTLYHARRDEAFEVQVGIHELLGHGCGKLLQESEPGKFNFDKQNPPTSPLDGKPVSSWYKPGQTWNSVFGGLSPPYEECRAELVAMALSCDFDILKIFGLGDGNQPSDENLPGDAGDVLYVTYLSMARAGIAAVEFWDPRSRKWGQAHMQARFSILKTFLEAGPDFCRLEYSDKENLSDLTVKIERSRILDLGRPAVERYLQQLAIYKATADFEHGKGLFERMTNVDEWWASNVRTVVLEKKTPRKVFVQANTVEEGGKIVLREYDPTPEGMIRSFVEREYI